MSISVDLQNLESMSITVYPMCDYPFFVIRGEDGSGSKVIMYVKSMGLLDRIRPHVEAINAILSEPVAPTTEPTGVDPILETI